MIPKIKYAIAGAIVGLIIGYLVGLSQSHYGEYVLGWSDGRNGIAPRHYEVKQ